MDWRRICGLRLGAMRTRCVLEALIVAQAEESEEVGGEEPEERDQVVEEDVEVGWLGSLGHCI